MVFALGVMGVVRGYADSKGTSGETKAQPRPVGFARDVRPLLSDNCFACHGPDEKARKAGFRLDTQEGAFAQLKGGGRAIVPGKPDESDLIFRIESDDPELHMPPKKSGKQLTAEQVAVLRRWVEQGASWTRHWAFKPPRKPELPAVKNAAWPVNAVDRFLLARLEAEGLAPEPEAEQDRTHPPRHPRPDRPATDPPRRLTRSSTITPRRAYERSSIGCWNPPDYGEHMARFWLDAARYGDTHGLHLDNYREIWPYRDWVIRAFNGNKPFDQFIVEQLAGDLLPNPTLDQIVATGFNRCHISTNEGGSIEEEVYVRNVVDQVDTNGTVFMGLSTGCARCHDHKYDPIRAKDYYQLFAFFNNIDGPSMDGNSAKWEPIIPVPTTAQGKSLEAIDGEIAAIHKTIAIETARLTDSFDPKSKSPSDCEACEKPGRADFVWIDDALPPGARREGNSPWDFVGKPDHPVHSGRFSVRGHAKGLDQRVLLTRRG